MSENIIIAIIGMVGSIAGSALLINWRLKELERKVDIHNGYAEKFADINVSLAGMAKDIEYIKKAVEKAEA